MRHYGAVTMRHPGFLAIFSGFSLSKTSHKTLLPANLHIVSSRLCLVPIARSDLTAVISPPS